MIKFFVSICIIVIIVFFMQYYIEGETYGMKSHVMSWNEQYLDEYVRENYGWGGMTILVFTAKHDESKLWTVRGLVERYDQEGIYYPFETTVQFNGTKETEAMIYQDFDCVSVTVYPGQDYRKNIDIE